jgi:four helix bundle protein
MTNEELIERTMAFAIRVLRLAEQLPRSVAGTIVARQVARSGTSVAANYRAALRGKSRADFINKITIVLEEADETAFWVDLTGRAKLLPKEQLNSLRDEAEQLVRIFNSTRATALSRKS